MLAWLFLSGLSNLGKGSKLFYVFDCLYFEMRKGFILIGNVGGKNGKQNSKSDRQLSKQHSSFYYSESFEEVSNAVI